MVLFHRVDFGRKTVIDAVWTATTPRFSSFSSFFSFQSLLRPPPETCESTWINAASYIEAPPDIEPGAEP